ncbi:hypothetical protein [Leucobacter aridicollis]|uniref:hypothetical protein n=1 Tax=Leucobacter aridicollis TaxID=283878 RepID=UPI00210265AA|nr:hypothetical protein [Leucobacter aridicollis]UTX53381.1 hypothetical protein KI794_01040 [Leucobacter aridicollis]
MSITLTGTKAAILETELAADLENSRTEERDHLAYVKNPEHNNQPYRGLSEIRDTIEIITLKHGEAKKAADRERSKLGTADEIRKILTDTTAIEASARSELYAAINTVKDSLAALERARLKHRDTIGTGTQRLMNAGVPVEGAELDGEPITLRGGIEHAETTLRAIAEPITYEWAPAIQRYTATN